MTRPSPALQSMLDAFGKSMGDLMLAWLKEFAVEAPITALATVKKLEAGGHITLSASTSPVTQAHALSLSVTDTRGKTTRLGSVEFSTGGAEGSEA